MSGGLRWWVPPLLAMQFLTRIPVARLAQLDPEVVKAGLTRSVIWFPVVGALIGGITAGTMLLADQFWPRIIAVVLALIVEARLTGAFHEDAVADFCDGFGAGHTPQRIHEIMKDSRIGTYGTLGLGLGIALRGALLIALPAPLILPALVASASLGRWLAVAAMALIPPIAASGGLARDIGARTSGAQLAIASLLTAPFGLPAVLKLPLSILGALAAMGLFLLWFRDFLLRHLGGVTGDCLGFAAYAGQLIVLLAVSLHLP